MALVAAGLGFLAGMLNPSWQMAVEPAQLFAGLVHYPAATPHYHYLLAARTLLHQLSALFLTLLPDEYLLSWSLCGLAGALTALGLALWLHCFTRSALAAIAFPFFLFLLIPHNLAYWGCRYPLVFFAPFTSGIIGQAVVVLALAGVALNRPAGFFLLGLSPAIHFVLGSWALALTALTPGIGAGLLRIPRQRRWLLAGLGLAAPALLLHGSGFPVADEPLTPGALRILAAFVTGWDGHRHPVSLFQLHFLPLLLALFMTFRLNRPPRHKPNPPADRCRLLFQTSILLAIPLALLAALPGIDPAGTLTRLMPARFLTIPMLLLLPTLIGIAWQSRAPAALAAGLLPLVSFPFIDDFRIHLLLLGGAAGVIGLAARRAEQTPPGRVRLYRRAITAVLVVAAIAFFVESRSRASALSRFPATPLPSGNSLFWLVAPETPGLLQARTRHPLILDVALLDNLVYVPQSCPASELILNRLFGVSLFNPPPGIIDQGGLIAEPTATLWQNWTPGEWRALAAEYSFSAVVTPPDWQLQLPRLAGDQHATVYTITGIPAR